MKELSNSVKIRKYLLSLVFIAHMLVPAYSVHFKQCIGKTEITITKVLSLYLIYKGRMALSLHTTKLFYFL